MLAGYDPLILALHSDDELPLVPPSSQRPEGQLRLVEAEDPLSHLESKMSVFLLGSCKQAGLYRINLAIRDEFSEIIQDVTIQPGIFPVLTINI